MSRRCDIVGNSHERPHEKQDNEWLARNPAQHVCAVSILALLAALSVACPSPAWCSPKVDVLILLSGDHITGEIEKLDLGTLTFKTDDMGTLSIEWEKVGELNAPEVFIVETGDGSRYFGSLTSPAPGRITVSKSQKQILLDMNSVVRMYPIKRTFFRRIDGNVNIGLSYSKRSFVASLSLDSLATLGNAEKNHPARRYRSFTRASCATDGSSAASGDSNETLISGSTFGRPAVSDSGDFLCRQTGRSSPRLPERPSRGRNPWMQPISTLSQL